MKIRTILATTICCIFLFASTALAADKCGCGCGHPAIEGKTHCGCGWTPSD